MKRGFLSFLIGLTLILSSCGQVQVQSEIYVFRSVDPEDFMNKNYCELAVETTIQSNTEYSAVISGSVFAVSSSGYQQISVKKEPVSFTQEYGTVWSGELKSEDGQMTITVYMVRHGNQYIENSDKEQDYDGYRIVAGEYEEYTDVLYFFLGKYEYLRYK